MKKGMKEGWEKTVAFLSFVLDWEIGQGRKSRNIGRKEGRKERRKERRKGLKKE